MNPFTLPTYPTTLRVLLDLDRSLFTNDYLDVMFEVNEELFYYGVFNWILDGSAFKIETLLEDALDWMEELAYANDLINSDLMVPSLEQRQEKLHNSFNIAAKAAYYAYNYILDDWATPDIRQHYSVEEVEVDTDAGTLLIILERLELHDVYPYQGTLALGVADG